MTCKFIPTSPAIRTACLLTKALAPALVCGELVMPSTALTSTSKNGISEEEKSHNPSERHITTRWDENNEWHVGS